MAKKIKKCIIGERFGKLTVLSYGQWIGRTRTYVCKCDCGNKITLVRGWLTSGNRVSCGCMTRRQADEIARVQRGLPKRDADDVKPTPKPDDPRWRRTKVPEYRTWISMKTRCSGNGAYVPKGITVCQRWIDSFEAFYADMGPKPTPKHSIDRINTRGNYEPGNCRWATATEQARNTIKSRRIWFGDEQKSLADWADEYDLSRDALSQRLSRGQSIDRALLRPARKPLNDTAKESVSDILKR